MMIGRVTLARMRTGERRALAITSSEMPLRFAPSTTSGSFGSRKMSSCAWYRSLSRSTLAASAMRSASYSSTPR